MNPNQPMKVDPYTKAILTVIALALVSLAFRDVPVISTAEAAEGDSQFNPLYVNVVNTPEVKVENWPSALGQ